MMSFTLEFQKVYSNFFFYLFLFLSSEKINRVRGNTISRQKYMYNVENYLGDNWNKNYTFYFQK